jgi:hypothetical protein
MVGNTLVVGAKQTHDMHLVSTRQSCPFEVHAGTQKCSGVLQDGNFPYPGKAWNEGETWNDAR